MLAERRSRQRTRAPDEAQDSKPQRVPIFKQGCSPCKVQEIVRAWQALSEVKVVQVGQRKREKAGQILKRSRRIRKASKTKTKERAKRQGRDSMRLTAAGKHREVRELACHVNSVQSERNHPHPDPRPPRPPQPQTRQCGPGQTPPVYPTCCSLLVACFLYVCCICFLVPVCVYVNLCLFLVSRFSGYFFVRKLIGAVGGSLLSTSTIGKRVCC